MSEPSKDNSTTVKGNTNAHKAMGDLIKMNQSVAEVIEKAVKIFKMSENLLNKLINL